MLTNVEDAESLQGLARVKNRDYVTKTVHPLLIESESAEGWIVDKRNQRSVRLKRAKRLGTLLEDRVWTLLYRMGFHYLSQEGGGILEVNPRDPAGPKTKIDVIGIDTEVAVAFECKSSETFKKRPQFQEELGKHALVRQRFANSVNQQYPASFKRQVALAMFTWNVDLSDNDKERAKAENVVLFDEQDLEYYEELIAHLGPAAKYQFLADLLPGKSVPGLEMRVPAIKTKMGGHNCYTFSASPEYLLKIAYVSHRSKGKASDVDTYQRMIRRSRLKKIREYIDDNGIFPTNIVINLDRIPTFDRGQQDTDQESGIMGWLTLRPAFKSAWIIDGQHRLFAYSGHPKAGRGRLSVIAFEKLHSSDQARLFIDINAQQKSVKQSLLRELYAELHWNAVEPSQRVTAIVSKAVQALDAERDSPFYQRIVMSDESSDALHCMPFQGISAALEKMDFYIATLKRGDPVRYGPLWAGDDNDATLRRTVYVLKNWFKVIRDSASDWWDAGRGDGGGLAMNDSVVACVNVLRSVFHHVTTNGRQLVDLDDDDLFACVRPYAESIGIYLGSLTEDERKRFRELRGVQGQTTRMRRCQQAIHEQYPTFNPPGLQGYLETEKAQTNTRAKEITDRIETTLQKVVLEELRREFGTDDSQWWMLGIPKNVRLKVAKVHEEDDGGRGGREYYFDLIDYRAIALQNWDLFGPILGMEAGRANSGKEKRTSWMNDVNEIRRVVAHASSGVSVSLEKLEQIQDYDQWLTKQVVGGAESTGEET